MLNLHIKSAQNFIKLHFLIVSFYIVTFIFFLYLFDQSQYTFPVFIALVCNNIIYYIVKEMNSKKGILVMFVFYNILFLTDILLVWNFLPLEYAWFINLIIILFFNFNIRYAVTYLIALAFVLPLTPYASEYFVQYFGFNSSNVFTTQKSVYIWNVVQLFTIFLFMLLVYHFKKELNQIYKKNSELKKSDTQKMQNTEKHFVEAEIDYDQDDRKNNRKLQTKNKTEFVKSDNFVILFKDIVQYIEKEKPYKDPNFSLNDLAEHFQTNINYISKSININQNGENFKNLVNYYRIEYVKQEIDNGLKNRKLKDLYTAAGFEYQATFNRVFKEFEGVTPSEYIKSVRGITDAQNN
ncbi:helix-turn-helix domain-containing protein [Flavobacterium branchiophilum]|uniref:Probable transcriptional regulator, AraC family n=1 Tax=Flavobacterium branchiophilum (strain FL-15) TaxID=1034807 RepID=G2Z6G2_FLABF|nr:helix-turn-helix domain-containing protein [Flavobacterium branchiophilum]CCB70987.1 Probable transcriptional regulator, AraC family [Flavobacterium branchiophilum FL-15]